MHHQNYAFKTLMIKKSVVYVQAFLPKKINKHKKKNYIAKIKVAIQLKLMKCNYTRLRWDIEMHFDLRQRSSSDDINSKTFILPQVNSKTYFIKV